MGVETLKLEELEEENNQLREMAVKWELITEYLEITGVFKECDYSIVLDVLKKGTENTEKLEAILKVFTDQPSQVILWSPNKKQYGWNYPFTSKGEEMLSKILEEVLGVE